MYKLSPERLWTTVYQTDDEAYDLWRKMIGVLPERCGCIGEKPGGEKLQGDNFGQRAGNRAGGSATRTERAMSYRAA